MTRRTDGRRGADPDSAESSDSAYGSHTFVAVSKAGCSLPSEAFMARGETLTAAEWQTRHDATYPTENAAAPDATGPAA